MSIGPVSGNGISFALSAGKSAFWTVNTQAAYNQYVKLVDPSGNVVFTATGSGGTNGTPNQIGSGNFTAVAGNYTIYIGINNGAQWNQVIWDSDSLVNGGTVYYSVTTFISEDGGGTDYNDSVVSISYFNSVG
ncbi:hypothetical protein [Azospirillum canadense]|uniref:hypothetical protein n=1 Tax=Azospirillum canadense TaxID=403962 RepID=UPI0022277F3C|nr:hypothetical protein [Azospirillum canadense]MCW2239969.1 hypothetical protein [Azospirillum canadense]